MEKGYPFVWRSGEKPVLIMPDGAVLLKGPPCVQGPPGVVPHTIPYIITSRVRAIPSIITTGAPPHLFRHRRCPPTSQSSPHTST